MASSFRIWPSWGLAYIWHAGCVQHDDAVDMLRAFSRHPDLRPGFRHLIDFTDVSAFESDPKRLLELQTFMTGVVKPDDGEALMVLLANSPISNAMALPLLQFWGASPHVRPRLVESEEAALHILGLPELSIHDLRTEVAT